MANGRGTSGLGFAQARLAALLFRSCTLGLSPQLALQSLPCLSLAFLPSLALDLLTMLAFLLTGLVATRQGHWTTRHPSIKSGFQ